MRNGQPGTLFFLKFAAPIQQITDIPKEEYGAIIAAIKESEKSDRSH
jgi:hypothetical protein